MAGSSDSFDAAEFRTNIRAAMLMGLPADPAARPKFLFPDTRIAANHDAAGEPWDWTDAALGPAPRDPVLCGTDADEVVLAWVHQPASRVGSTKPVPFGTLDSDFVTITMLDVDWEKVRGFTTVEFGDSTYTYRKEFPEQGLFDVTVHQIVVTAQDET